MRDNDENDPRRDRDRLDRAAEKMLNAILMGGGMPFPQVDPITQLLHQMRTLPPVDRVALIVDVIGKMCTVAVLDAIPEAERSDPENWEDRSPADLFKVVSELVEPMFPPPDVIAEKWNEHVLEEAERMADSKAELTVADILGQNA